MNKNKTFLAAALVALAASLPVHAATDYTRTRYPIVLSHGLFGFKSVGPVDYWHAIVPALEKDGAKVFATSQSPVNSNEVRGEQLLAQVEEVLALTGAEKVNLIGHSQGGMTVRYVAGVAPQLVASVTTMGTPHKGTPVADAVTGFSEFLGPIGTEVIASAVEALFSVVDIVDGPSGRSQPVARPGQPVRERPDPGLSAACQSPQERRTLIRSPGRRSPRRPGISLWSNGTWISPPVRAPRGVRTCPDSAHLAGQGLRRRVMTPVKAEKPSVRVGFAAP